MENFFKHINFKEWFRVQEATIGNLVKGDKNWKVKFNDVKFDTTDKYYVNLNRATSNITDINQVEIGDKVQDYVMSKAPYWSVTGIDVQKNTLFLEPIGSNPFKPNPSGEIIGAGGKVFDVHDFDVMSGEYESRRIDQLLDVINSKDYHSISDIAYILLGTVPVQIGPNGSQGGWYNATDSHNRGHQKGLDPRSIMQRDAQTLKDKLGFDVPENALDGSLNPSRWSDFVNDDYSERNAYATKMDYENFSSPEMMAKMVLSNKQPLIRKRNADLLLRLTGSSEDIDKLIRNTAIELAKQKILRGKHFDVLWHMKEMFILQAKRNGWIDVLEAFHDSPDSTNRRYVANSLKRENLDVLLKMLQRETKPEVFYGLLESLYNILAEGYKKVNQWGFSEVWFTDFIANNPEERSRVSELADKILPAVFKKHKDVLIENEEDKYYMDQANVYLKRLKIIKAVLDNK